MAELIVNADDLGNGSCRDRGIFEAFQNGIVTSASILANGETFTEAMQEARSIDLRKRSDRYPRLFDLSGRRVLRNRFHDL